MILQGARHFTKSGRPKQGGKWDWYELVPENDQEKKALGETKQQTRINRGMPITDFDRAVQDLRRLGKSRAVVGLTEKIERIQD